MLFQVLFLILCILVGSVYKLRRFSHTISVPKGYRPFVPIKITDRDVDMTREAYRLRKLPNDIDHIIIGSGIGGLYSAAMLSKIGRRCVVLEQHYVAGGCTHTFQEKGFEFDTGIHYIGEIKKIKYLLDLVSDPEHKVQWEKIGTKQDGYCFDRIKVGDEEVHRLCSGKQTFIDDLVKRFPEERAAIEKYVKLVEEANKSSKIGFFSKIFHPIITKYLAKFLMGKYKKFALMTLQEVLDSITKNNLLKAILSGQCGDHGETPDNASFIIHAAVVAHYFEGGYYPKGGSQEISRALIPTIEATGGRVFVRAKVKSILLDPNGKAIGVEMENNDRILCKESVISSAGIKATYEQLLPKHVKKPECLKTLAKGTSHLYCFVGLEGTSEELGLESSNLWILPFNGKDVSQAMQEYYQDPFQTDKMMVFLGFPSVKDSTFQKRFPNKSTCIMLTEARREWFENWEEGKCGARGEEYESLKAKITDKMMEILYHYYPKTRGKVKFLSTASPLTNEFYLGRTESYGLAHNCERFTSLELRPQTDIPNLFLTGQDIFCAGFAGALFGGLIATQAVLGYNFFDIFIKDRNLIQDFKNLASIENGTNKILNKYS